jgi:hypothetical protein
MRIPCTRCGRTTVEGMCPDCGKPPLPAQLKMALLGLVALAVMSAIALMNGPPIDVGAKKKPAAASPSR